jgi:molybdopterin/thiamine biosynthesis adenylyltransferase
MNGSKNTSEILNMDELERYDRQIILSEIGPLGQARLKRSKIFIAGAGGLGSSIALHLTAAGIGMLKIVDNDRVALSNLNRQLLHGTPDLGKYKVDSARETLTRLNPNTHIEAHALSIDEANAAQLIQGCDVIVDALDNMATRFILNRVAVAQSTPLIHGAVNGFEGRALTIIPGQSACLQCISRPTAHPTAKFPVLGVAPGVIGTLQATEAIKCLLNIGSLLTGRLVQFDGLAMTWREFKVKKNPVCSHCGHLSG